MRKIIGVVALVAMVGMLAGCDNFKKNTRQTGKNIKATVLDGHDQDLYADK